MKFRDKLQFLLERDGISVPKLAEETGISSQTIYSILKRDGDKTKLSHLRKFCDFFNVTLEYLVDDEVSDPNFGQEGKLIIGSNSFGIDAETGELIPQLENSDIADILRDVADLPEEALGEIKYFIDLISHKYRKG